MHRIDTSGSQNGSFVDEDLQKGVQGTLLSAAWLNAIQDEVASVIESTKAKLDKAKNNQLLIAITSLIEPVQLKIDRVLNAVEQPVVSSFTLAPITRLLAIYSDSTGNSLYRPVENTAGGSAFGSFKIESSRSHETTEFIFTFTLNLPAPKGWDGGWLIEIPVSAIPNLFYLGKFTVPANATIKESVRERRVYGTARLELIQPYDDKAYISVFANDGFNFQEGEKDKVIIVSMDGILMTTTQNIKPDSIIATLKEYAFGTVDQLVAE